MFVSLISFCQDTVVTANGDKYTYYLNANIFSQFRNSKTKLAVELFASNEGDKSVWLQNISLKEVELKRLMNYIDSIPNLAVGARTYEEHMLSSFEIYSNDNTNKDFIPMNKYGNRAIDIIQIQNKIKEFFKNN